MMALTEGLTQISILGDLPVGILTIILIWTLIWKGLALWKSARLGKPVWFVIMLLISTLGILEILYIFVFSKMKSSSQASKPKSAKKK